MSMHLIENVFKVDGQVTDGDFTSLWELLIKMVILGKFNNPERLRV